MSEFLKVKRACVVLDPNGRNELNIEFDEPIPSYDHNTQATIINDEYGGYSFYGEDHGIAYFGCYDPHGKFWSSRPSVFRDQGDRPISVSFVTPSKFLGFSRTAGAITESFCKKILEDFHIPFHIEYVKPFSDNEIVSELVQNRDIIGSTFTDQYDTVWKIKQKSEQVFASNRYVCFAPYERKSRYYGFKDLPRELYDGLFWEDFKAIYMPEEN